jgi:type VI secretion system secreted protein VgrG
MKNVILCIGDEEEEDPFHVFEVRQFSIRERMNAVFEVNVLVVSPFEDLNFGDIVGLDATVSLENSVGIWRGYSGLIRRMEQVRIEQTGLTHYALTLVPYVWQLSQRRNYRIFEHLTTQDIITKLLDEWQIDYEWYLDRRDYPKHEYKVQYGETDLQFIERLLEEAGISYYFWDDPSDDEISSHLQFDDTPQTSDVRYGDPIRYVDNPNEAQGGGEFVSEVTLMHDVRPGMATVRDFDFRRRPDAQLFGNADPAAAPENQLEHYVYDPNGFLFDTEKGDANTPVADDKSKARHLDLEGDNEAEIILEQLRVGKRHVTYRSSCHDLSPGVRFQMIHPRDDLGLEDLVAIESHIFGKHDGEWVLRGHAVFADDVYRPAPRTKKPKVDGVQTAIVVGPKGEEIYTDEFGRVRVRFIWDREGDFDDNRTCWLRVAQDWAGGAFGGQRIPRIDQEVIVNFLEGDPDNPVIVGRLYNNTTKVPYPLPKHKVVSTNKSNSSPHGGGFNEIMFDDSAGKEVVYLQAEKDLWKVVKNDEVETTGNDRQIQIAQNQNTTIGNIDGSAAGTRHQVSVGSSCILKQDELIEITVGDASVTLDGPDITIVAKSDMLFSALGDFVIQGGPNVRINCEDDGAKLWSEFVGVAQAQLYDNATAEGLAAGGT